MSKNKENVKIKGRFIRVPTGITATVYVWLDITRVQYVTESSDKSMCHVAMLDGEISFVKIKADEMIDLIILLEA